VSIFCYYKARAIYRLPAKIKTLYRLASKKYHPDRGGSQEAFVKLGEAYEAFLNNSYIDTSANTHYKASGNSAKQAYTDYDNEYYKNAYQHAYSNSHTHYTDTTNTAKPKRSKLWYVLWPLRGFLYALSLLVMNALFYIYVLAAFVASICFIVSLFKLFTAIFDNGLWTDVLQYAGYAVGLFLVICPCDWLEDKKEDVLYAVWRFWRL